MLQLSGPLGWGRSKIAAAKRTNVKLLFYIFSHYVHSLLARAAAGKVQTDADDRHTGNTAGNAALLGAET